MSLLIYCRRKTTVQSWLQWLHSMYPAKTSKMLILLLCFYSDESDASLANCIMMVRHKIFEWCSTEIPVISLFLVKTHIYYQIGYLRVAVYEKHAEYAGHHFVKVAKTFLIIGSFWFVENFEFPTHLFIAFITAKKVHAKNYWKQNSTAELGIATALNATNVFSFWCLCLNMSMTGI